KVTMHVLRYIILYNIVLLALFWANAENPVSYPIDWEGSSSTFPDSRNLESSYLGECVCDMTWGVCDPNCCCDTDCTVEEKQKFLFCLQETVGSSSMDYCYEKQQDEKVTRSSRRYLDRANVGSSAVCIVRSNNLEDLNSFFCSSKRVPKTSREEIY
ncbi:Tectonic-1, partial [Trypanosoma cruzi]